MTKVVDIRILNEILDFARIVLLTNHPLSMKARADLLKTSTVFETLPTNLSKYYKSELTSFKLLLLGKHPIFKSSKFLTVEQYNPLHPENYNKNHKIPYTDTKSDTHGNNYIFARTNLRNGVLFTYHDEETDSFIPVTFNTNAPICLVAIPYYLSGDELAIIRRMISEIHEISKNHSLRNFPLVVKGLSKQITYALNVKAENSIVELDKDVSTITAEENFPALSYDIRKVKSLVKTGIYQGIHKKPKAITLVKKLNKVVYCEDWQFDMQEANFIARKWALSKLERLERRGITDIDPVYLINTIAKPLTERPPGKQNQDYFACAIRATNEHDSVTKGELLGVIVASRNNQTVAGLNAVVVPVNKIIRNLGYYSVYKLAEKMYTKGITSYWHGPKELDSDEHAIIEFLGLPHKVSKKYCIKVYTGKGYDTIQKLWPHVYTSH